MTGVTLQGYTHRDPLNFTNSSYTNSAFLNLSNSAKQVAEKIKSFCIDNFVYYKKQYSSFLANKPVHRHHPGCSILSTYNLQMHQLLFEGKIAKKETETVELKQTKKLLKEINIGGIEITDQQIEQIKEAITKIINLLTKLKSKHSKKHLVNPENFAYLEECLEKGFFKEKTVIETLLKEHKTRLNRVREKIEKAKEDLHHTAEQINFNKDHLNGCAAARSSLIEKGILILKEIPSKIYHTVKDKIHPPKPLVNTEFAAAVYNAKNRSLLPGTKVYDNFSDKYKNTYESIEEAAKGAYENSMAVLNFWWEVFKIHSYDDMGKRIDAVIHFMKNYVNAFFNGQQMVYGDGNKYFGAFWKFLDIAGHEMGHALVGDKLGEYNGQRGALNEHYADVFGACAAMHANGQSVLDYHWNVGDGLYTYKGQSYSLRTFKEGPAYVDVPGLGTDPQPDTYDAIVNLDPNSDLAQIMAQDNDGVHELSKWGNRVFNEIATHYGTGKADDFIPAVSFWKKTLDKLEEPPAGYADFAAFQINLARTEPDANLPGLAEELEKAWDKVKVPFRNVVSFVPDEARPSIDVKAEVELAEELPV